MGNGLSGFEFREILKDNGISQKDFSQMVGMSYSGVRNVLSRGTKKGVVVWLKSFLLGYELGKMNVSKKKDPSGE